MVLWLVSAGEEGKMSYYLALFVGGTVLAVALYLGYRKGWIR